MSRRESAVAQLFLLGGFELLHFMKTSRLIVWPAILAVAGLAYWLAIPNPPASQGRIRVEDDTAQISAAHPVSSYDYYSIPQNRTPEVAVPLLVDVRDFHLPLNSEWGRKYD
jgi:hypothetical protein